MRTTVYLVFISSLLSACILQTPKEKFTKIIYHTTTCFGTCPVYHLEINKDQSFKLFAQTAYKKSKTFSYNLDTAKMGYFKGKIEDSLFNSILDEMEKMSIDTISFANIQCCDAPIKTVIAYYNGKRNFLKSMDPPKKTQKLLSLLYKICSTENLVRVKNPFVIENDR